MSFVLINSDYGALIINRLDRNPENMGVGAQIMDHGCYDPGELDDIKNFLLFRREVYGNGVTMLDCGANIGATSLPAARLMKDWGRVIAVEAQERIYYALAGNIALHNLYNVKATLGAISDRCGEMTVPVPDYTKPGSFGSLELKDRVHRENIGQDISYDYLAATVPCFTIDSLKLERLDFLKMDIEGMEIEGIAGAAETLRTCKPILQIEAIKVDGDGLVKALEKFGYLTMPVDKNIIGIHRDDKCAGLVKAA